MRAYIDSDVLIWHLRGEAKARDLLLKIQAEKLYDLYIGVMQRAEIIFFMKPKEEKGTELFLSQFKTQPVDQKIIDRAGMLYRKWHPGYGIDVNDAILAATAMQTGGIIYTLNTKHFPMPEINVQKAW